METKTAAPILSNQSQGVSTAKEERFGSVMTHQQAELAAVAVAAAARAEVESAYVLAIKNPRKEDESRRRILDSCLNLKFAESAIYNKPVGKKQVGGQWVENLIEGLSIRFAEEAIRLWRNIKTLQTTIYDDPLKRIVKITVIDLESNVSYSKEYVIEKTVERKNAVGRDVVYERTNTKGEKISVVVATEDEVANKESSIGSKTIRNNGLRLIPDYILTEALDTIKKTVKEGINKDPAGARRAVVDNFAKLNITVKQLEDYIKKPIDQITGDEIASLKGIFNSLHEGATTWAEVLEQRTGTPKAAEVIPDGFVAPPRKDGETEFEYEDRYNEALKEHNTKGGFKAGSPASHTSVQTPLKK